MKRAEVIAALEEMAASNAREAGVWDVAQDMAVGDAECASECASFAEGHRVDAGVCLAAINHLNGVSPE